MRALSLLACLLLTSLVFAAPASAVEPSIPPPQAPCEMGWYGSTSWIVCFGDSFPTGCAWSTGPEFLTTGGFVGCSTPAKCPTPYPVDVDVGVVYVQASQCFALVGFRAESAAPCRFDGFGTEVQPLSFGCSWGNVQGWEGLVCALYHNPPAAVVCTVEGDCSGGSFHTDGPLVGVWGQGCTFAAWARPPPVVCPLPSQGFQVSCSWGDDLFVRGAGCGAAVSEYSANGTASASCSFDADCFAIIWGYDVGVAGVGGGGCGIGAWVDPDGCPIEANVPGLTDCTFTGYEVGCSATPLGPTQYVLCSTNLPCGRHVDTFEVGRVTLIANTCRVGVALTS